MPRGKKVNTETEIEENDVNIESENIYGKFPEIEILQKENADLKKKLEQIEKMLNIAASNNVEIKTSTNKITNEADDEYVEIKPNKYIKVMSLNFGRLVISTEGNGVGKIFDFAKFGDVKNITYMDLSDLIHHQQKFAEGGKFYIFDKNVVRNHGLTEYYNKFMTKDMIEHILDYKKDELLELFNNTTKSQQEVIVNILIQKIKAGEDVDLNKVDAISRVYGLNIVEIAKETIEEE